MGTLGYLGCEVHFNKGTGLQDAERCTAIQNLRLSADPARVRDCRHRADLQHALPAPGRIGRWIGADRDRLAAVFLFQKQAAR